MLKQILTTSALIIIGVASIQSAAAADASKFRQLIVEPSGKAVGALPTKKLHLIVAPQPGIPAPSSDPVVTADNGNNQPGKRIQLIVAPPQGVPAPSEAPIITVDNRNDQPTKTEVQPLIFVPEGTPSADAGAQAPADPVDSADATPPQDPAPIDQPADTASGAADQDATATDSVADDATPADSEPAPAGVHNPRGLYTLLTDRGYDVEIVKRHDDGNLVFLVTEAGHDQDGLLLLVDGHYGKVLVRKSIALADYGYARHEPRYPAVSYRTDSYNSDNCDYGDTGYRHTVARY